MRLMKIPEFLEPYVQAGHDFLDDDAPQSAAALSFYGITALPPLVMVLLSILGTVYAEKTAVKQLSDQVESLAGPMVAEIISTIVENSSNEGYGWTALMGTAVLLFSASGFFSQLQKALNQAWGVRLKPDAGLKLTIKNRLLSVLAVISTGVLVLFSLFLTTVISAAGRTFEETFGQIYAMSAMIELGVSLIVITGLLAMIFKLLPDALISWSDVWQGALTTALFFMLAKVALGWYLARADLGASYGSSGALVGVLFWVYFSSMILLYGAQLTKVQARRKGQNIVAESYAEMIVVQAVSEPDTADQSETVGS